MDQPSISYTSTPTPRVASIPMRVVMGVVGVVALYAMSRPFGRGVYVGAFGILIAWAIAERRRGVLTKLGSWFGAVLTVGAMLAFSGLITATQLPAGSVRKFEQTFDSASTARRAAPPPAWVERMAPGTAASSKVQQSMMGPRTMKAMAVWGAAMAVIMMWTAVSVFVGTMGWGAGLLLALGLTGRWIGAPRSILPDS